MEHKLAYRLNELAKAGGPGRTKLYQAIRRGELRARKVGRSTIVVHEDYLEYLKNLPVKQVGEA